MASNNIRYSTFVCAFLLAIWCCVIVTLAESSSVSKRSGELAEERLELGANDDNSLRQVSSIFQNRNRRSSSNEILRQLWERQLKALATQDDVLQINNDGKQSTGPFRGINKRHCWDVSDVCCMWNVC